MKRLFLSCLLAGLGVAAQAAGFLPVAEGLKPLKQRLQAIAEEIRPLRLRLQQAPAADEAKLAVQERALAWSRLQDLLDEQARLQGELDEAQLAARDPLRQH
ncbi:hypothetical protein [Pelomonas sp. BJYL3]|uniref:hypothetical protein n=1 Tax=Pelomonas sp. BJYL3 TaxID=2976697 RepID=UPI0022B2C5BC|nr:hypothetical protein [Pelomonas sp. BJYL3]